MGLGSSRVATNSDPESKAKYVVDSLIVPIGGKSGTGSQLKADRERYLACVNVLSGDRAPADVDLVGRQAQESGCRRRLAAMSEIDRAHAYLVTVSCKCIDFVCVPAVYHASPWIKLF